MTLFCSWSDMLISELVDGIWDQAVGQPLEQRILAVMSSDDVKD